LVGVSSTSLSRIIPLVSSAIASLKDEFILTNCIDKKTPMPVQDEGTEEVVEFTTLTAVADIQQNERSTVNQNRRCILRRKAFAKQIEELLNDN
jgi:hypothetical protein